jgi:hypothetical protein
MKGLVVLTSVLLLGFLSAPAYGFSHHGVWVGGNIIIDIDSPDEVKGGDVMTINLDIRVLKDVEIEYFIIRIEQFPYTLHSKTLWQNQRLAKDFKYSETISLSTREVIWRQDNIRLAFEAKYSDGKWIYTASPSLVIALAGSPTYADLSADYATLDGNYRRLASDYWALNLSHRILQGEYNSLNQTYATTLVDYQRLESNYTDLLHDFDAVEALYEDAVTKISSLEYEKGALTFALAIMVVVVLLEAGLIVWIKRRAVTQKGRGPATASSAEAIQPEPKR